MYHKALCYCLGISDDTRRNINSIYDFKTGCVKTECLHEGWQTSGSMKVVRMAFNLYCNGAPSVDDYTKTEGQTNITELMENFKEKEYKVFEMFDKQWAIVTAGSMEHYNSCTVSWGSLGNIWGHAGNSRPTVTVYVHPARYTSEFLKNSDTFTVSFYS